MIRNFKRGFTLIELLVVIGIIGILAAIVLVAVNPGRQFAQARNTQRQSDLLAITNAVYQFASENDGNLPATAYTGGLPTAALPECTGPDVNGVYTGTEIGGTGGFNLAAAGAADATGNAVDPNTTIVPTYIASVPFDPSTGSAAATDYFICVMPVGEPSAGRVYAYATDELGTAVPNQDINVLR